jgi:cytochrome P450
MTARSAVAVSRAPDAQTLPPVASYIRELVGSLERPTGNFPLRKELGHLPGNGGLWTGIKNVIGLQRRGSDAYLDLVRQYGPVFRTAVGLYPIVVVADAEMVGAIGRNDERSWSTPLGWRVLLDGLDPTTKTSDGPTGFDFETHRDVRRFLQPAFSNAALAGYVDTAAGAYERAIEGWAARGSFAFRPAVRALFADVASQIFMGIDDPAQARMLDLALADFWGALLALFKRPALSLKWRKGMRGHRILREALRAQVDARRAGNGADLFSRMCRTGKEDLEWLDDDTIVRLFLGVMVAAFDTTSLATTSMAYLLAKNPIWQARLRVESQKLGPGPLKYDDAKRLEEHEWVWKETLRLFPVAANFPRRAVRDVRLGEHLIPEGTLVFAQLSSIMRDPTWWTRPAEFEPERFSPSRAEDKRHKGAFVPFGVGPHVCIGLQLAGLEVKAFWHALLSKYRIRLTRDYPVHHEARPLGSVSGPVDVVLERL